MRTVLGVVGVLAVAVGLGARQLAHSGGTAVHDAGPALREAGPIVEGGLHWGATPNPAEVNEVKALLPPTWGGRPRWQTFLIDQAGKRLESLPEKQAASAICQFFDLYYSPSTDTWNGERFTLNDWWGWLKAHFGAYVSNAFYEREQYGASALQYAQSNARFGLWYARACFQGKIAS